MARSASFDSRGLFNPEDIWRERRCLHGNYCNISKVVQHLEWMALDRTGGPCVLYCVSDVKAKTHLDQTDVDCLVHSRQLYEV